MKITFFFTHQNHTTNFYSLLYYYSIFSINTSIYITIYILFIDFYSVEIYLYYSSITKQNFCFCFDQSSTATLFFTISVGSSIFSSGFLAKKKLLFHSFFFFATIHSFFSMCLMAERHQILTVLQASRSSTE